MKAKLNSTVKETYLIASNTNQVFVYPVMLLRLSMSRKNQTSGEIFQTNLLVCYLLSVFKDIRVWLI